jgi:hypothetical protein
MRVIELETEKNVTAIQEVICVTDKIYISNITDTGQLVLANINVKEYNISLVLWDGDDYISIGQWTDEQAENKIKELLNIN